MSGYTALLDACVLYPAPVRDVLLQLAVTDCFQCKMILKKWKLEQAKCGRMRLQMQNAEDLSLGQMNRISVDRTGPSGMAGHNGY